jgi:hypothetical protein
MHMHTCMPMPMLPGTEVFVTSPSSWLAHLFVRDSDMTAILVLRIGRRRTYT